MNIRKLTTLIDGKKITKASIIKKTGISRPALDSILDGNDFKVSNLEKIAHALCVSVGYFFDDDIVIEEYHAHGEKGMAVKQIDYVDQRTMDRHNDSTEKEESTEYLKAQISTLQKELLDARAKIIALMEEKK